MAVHYSDCLVAVGARFDDRVTGKIEEFAPRAVVVQIDVDPSTISKNVSVDIPIVGDARSVLLQLLEEWSAGGAAALGPPPGPWLDRIAVWRRDQPLRYEQSADVIKPQYVMDELSRLLPDDAVVVTGVGQHQMWAAQHVGRARPRRFCTSGGLGAMGYGLPAAIGAKAAFPDKLVVNIDGDGSVLLSSQEMATLAEAKLSVKTILVNNSAHGMVRQWQKLLYDRRYSAVDLSVAPDFVKLAEAYGCSGARVRDPRELTRALEHALGAPGPFLLDVVVDQEECVFPMVRAGDANKDMLLAPPSSNVPSNGPGLPAAGREPHVDEPR
jgi:acetolactate synthase-1/2/3 large subunit